MGRISARWRSIDRRLPLLISSLLLGTVAAFTWTAYQRIEGILLTTAGTRLQAASAPVASLLEQSTTTYRARLATVARDPVVARYLATKRGAGAARLALAHVWGPADSAPARIELRDADGTVVLDTSRRIPPRGSGWIDRMIAAQVSVATGPLLGPFRSVGASTYGESVVAIAPAAGDSGTTPAAAARRPLGYIAELKIVSSAGAQTVRDLIGPHAALLVGTPGEGQWTNLTQTSPPPPPGMRVGHALIFASAQGRGVGAATAIRGTPWVLWVEQPGTTVLAPMRRLLLEMAALAGLFVMIGATGAWFVSRRITRPIVSLTEAAERVAAAGSSQSTTTEAAAGDEITRLADAFARMSARVNESHQELEQRVAERTIRLQEAMAKLETAHLQLVQKERLAMLGQLASAVGHELRNPLGVMTNALYVIDQSLPDAQPLVREYFGLLRGQIAISERIIGDLLDTARVRPPQITAVDLPALVDTQLERLGPLAGVEVRREFPAGLPRTAIDPAHLAQILLNLLSNAVQAMSDAGGGTLTIAGEPAPDGRVRLTIADTGPGMTPEILDRIFEPLFTTKARGLGLGLWVSRTLATTNGATLDAASRVGNGACFTLIMASAARQQAEAA